MSLPHRRLAVAGLLAVLVVTVPAVQAQHGRWERLGSSHVDGRVDHDNINVGIHYLGAWLAGNGCVPIHNLMEDAATAEISRAQVWQWIRSAKGVLEDGKKVTAEMVVAMIPEELAKVKALVGDGATYDRAAKIFEEMSTSASFAEFLTLPLYEEI